MTDDAADEDLLDASASRKLREFLALQSIPLIIAAILPASHFDLITCQLMFGIVISQGVLAGVWLALGPGPLVQRFVGVPLWTLLAATAGNRSEEAFVILLSIAGGNMLMIAFVLFGGRLLLGWRLGRLQDTPDLPLQYGIKHLIILMAVVSVLAAAFTELKDQLPILFVVGIGGVFAMGLIASVVVPLLPASRGWLIGGLTFAAGTAFLVSLGLAWRLRQGSWFLFRGNFYLQVIVIGMTAFVAVTLSMLLVRAAGYRLISGKRKQSLASGAWK